MAIFFKSYEIKKDYRALRDFSGKGFTQDIESPMLAGFFNRYGWLTDTFIEAINDRNDSKKYDQKVLADAFCTRKHGHLFLAEECNREADKMLASNDPYGNYYKSMYYYYNGLDKRYSKHLNKALADEIPEAFVIQGDIHSKNGNIEKAISFYKKAQDYGLNDVLWKLYFTESTHKTKDKNKSSRLRELLDKAVEESTPSGFYLKGEAYHFGKLHDGSSHTKDHKLALEFYQKAIRKKNPNDLMHIFALVNSGLLYEKLGDRNSLIAALRHFALAKYLKHTKAPRFFERVKNRLNGKSYKTAANINNTRRKTDKNNGVYQASQLILTDDNTWLDRSTKQPITGQTIFTLEGIKHDVHIAQGKRHGISKIYYKNGRLQQITPYKNGIREGLIKTYRDDGSLDAVLEFKNDKKNGVVKQYSQQGKLIKKEFYIDDQQHGDSFDYFANGSLKRTAKFINGKREGEVKAFYASGKLKSIIPFAEDKPHGKVTLYYENGKISGQGQYIHDSKEGIFSYFDDKGKLTLKETFKNSKKNGTAKYYYESSNKVKILCNYVDDVMNGDYKTYHQNGYLQSKGKYKQGKKQGMTLYYSSTHSELLHKKTDYDQDTELQSLLISYYVDKKTEEIIGIWKEEEMKGKSKHGISREYNKSGDLLSEIEYTHDKKNGLSAYYSQSFLFGGLLTSEEIYEDNVLIDSSRYFFNSLVVFLEWIVLIIVLVLLKFRNSTINLYRRYIKGENLNSDDSISVTSDETKSSEAAISKPKTDIDHNNIETGNNYHKYRKLLLTASGRVGRQQYITGLLLINICSLVFGVSSYYFFSLIGISKSGLAITILILIPVLMYTNLCLIVKRFHDCGFHGAWLFLFIVFRKIDNVLFMLISLIMIITLFVKKGTKGANRFGDDPLQESNQ